MPAKSVTVAEAVPLVVSTSSAELLAPAFTLASTTEYDTVTSVLFQPLAFFATLGLIVMTGAIRSLTKDACVAALLKLPTASVAAPAAMLTVTVPSLLGETSNV